MTSEERNLVAKIETQDLTLNNPKIMQILPIYFKVLRSIIENSGKDAHFVAERFLRIKTLCQEYERTLPIAYKRTDEQKINLDILSSMYWECLKVESFYIFDSFCLYMEKNRHPSKKFYAPRRNVLKTVADDLQEFEESKDLLFYGLSLPSRVGKAVSFDTPILTENGWKKHGDLTIRDRVVGADGQYKRILQIHPPCEMEYKVTFADGESIICHGNHEWYVHNRRLNKFVTIETKEMAKCYVEKDGHNIYSLPISSAVEGNDIELGVAPYTLGAWLGDGRNTNPDICESKEDNIIVQTIAEKYPILWNTTHKTTKAEYYGFKGLRDDLQKYGMCHSRRTTPKHIPDIYFRASKAQRLELLAGLLDTDGTLTAKDNRYSFSTTEEALRDDFVKLVSSFGWRVCVCETAPRISSSGIKGNKTVYRISFNPTEYIPCRVPRKQLKEFSVQRRIGIEKIERITEKVMGNCISVEGGLYCVGDRLKVTHNSTICIFFLAWIMLRRPNSHSAMGGHSGVLCKGFYKEVLNLISTEEYTYAELYAYYHPEYQNIITDKSAEDCTVTLGDPDRFATLTCRGIDGTWTGAIDVSSDGYLYVDDLVRDREHSLNPNRMENTYQEYLNKMVDRKNDGAKELMVGTLWNIYDPLMKIEAKFKNDPRYKFRRIPALDYETDESNFNYQINGFSTQYYREMRDRLEPAEWNAKFQQSPQIREGILFPELKRFHDLPSATKQVYAVCDPALGGGDYLSMPIEFVFENELHKHYIVDWVYDKSSPKTTVPKMVDRVIKWGITEIQIEIDGGAGALVHKELIDEIKRRNCQYCEVIPIHSSNKLSKEDKIKGRADYIKDNFFFLDEKYTYSDFKYHDEYRKAVNDTELYTTLGKNMNDDAPDSLAQMALKHKPFTENGIISIPDINPFRNYGGKIY